MARSQLVDVSVTRRHHGITRYVRRAFLLTEGPLDRKEWIELRLKKLADIFAVAVGGFSVMDPIAQAQAVCYRSSRILFESLSRGAHRPGCRGIMAKPVKVRRCRATVTRFDRRAPGQLSRRGISREARSPASISCCDHLAKGGPDFAISVHRTS